MPPFNLSTLVTNPVVQAGVFLPFVLVVIDFLTGSLAAMRQGTFDFSKWSNLYQPSQVNDLVRCMISAVVVALVALLGALFWGDQGAGLAASVSALLGVTTISTKIIKSIASNLSLFADLGYSVPDRMVMVEALSQSLYRSGLIGLPARKLQRYVPVALLTDLLWQLFCYAPLGLLQERLVQYFLQQPEFTYYAKQRFLSEVPKVHRPT